MKTYIVLLRGINVGGKNKVPMVALRQCLEALGFVDVTTYIASGNVLLKSKKSAAAVRALIEDQLPKTFKLDSKLVKALVLTPKQLKSVVEHKPKGFGELPQKYHSDVMFLIDLSPTTALRVFTPREGVDMVWAGKGVIYSQRLSAQRSKSKLSAIVGTPAYQCMTGRNWNTVMKLVELLGK